MLEAWRKKLKVMHFEKVSKKGDLICLAYTFCENYPALNAVDVSFFSLSFLKKKKLYRFA